MAMAEDTTRTIRYVVENDPRLRVVLSSPDPQLAKDRLRGFLQGMTMDYMGEFLRDTRLSEAANACLLTGMAFAWLTGTDFRRPMGILRYELWPVD